MSKTQYNLHDSYNAISDDNFLDNDSRVILVSKYPEIEIYKTENETWNQFFTRATHTIDLMKENYKYEYTFGNFETQYNLLKKYDNMNDLLKKSSFERDLALIAWSLKNGADIHTDDDCALRWACGYGDLKTVKYLLAQGANINAHNFLKTACMHVWTS